MNTPIDRLLIKLTHVQQNGNGWQARCPAHADDNPSLSITEGRDGRVLLHCHAGCSPLAVCRAVGLTLVDLMPGKNGKPQIVAQYNYRNEAGKLLYQSVRFEPKDFRQRRPDGNDGWTWSLNDVPRVLYRLPELLAADPQEPVFIVEGEKDADRLAALGLVTTCSPGGAGKWRDEYGKSLSGRQVVIFADNDDAGKAHADTVAKSLQGTASHLKIVVPPVPAKGDIADWLDAHPYFEAEEVKRLAVRRAGKRFRGGATADAPIRIVPLIDLITQHPKLRQPIIDGLLRQGELMNIIAASKVGKSWLAHGLALSVARGQKWLDRFPVTQGRVLLIDNELHPETISYRTSKVAESMGLSLDGIDILPLREKVMSYVELTPIVNRIEHGRYVLVVVDAHYRMLPSMSENDNAEVMRVYNLLDSFAAKTGAGWVLIHHASKGDQSDKTVTDVGAGAGSQSRAADTHLILRRHETDGAFVMEAVVRSFPPPEPLVLRWELPLWVPDDSLNPKQLETTETRKSKRNDNDARQMILGALNVEPQTANALAGSVGMGRLRCQRVLKALADEGLVEAESTSVRGNTTMVYRPTK